MTLESNEATQITVVIIINRNLPSGSRPKCPVPDCKRELCDQGL